MTPPSSESGLNLEPVGTPPGAFSETPLLGARESVHFIRRLMHLAPDIVYVYDYRTQKLLYVNHRLTDVLGYTEADLPALNYSLVNLVIAPDPQQLGAYLDQRFADADETVEYEFTVRHKDGSPRVMRTRGSVLRRDETGQPAEVMGISEDVTAEHRSLAARRRSAAQLNESQRLFHYGSWDWKVSEERVCYSDELFRIFGYDPAEFPDGFAPRNFYLQHVPEAEREAMNEQVWGAIDAGKSYEVEHNLLARDGTHKRLRLRGSLFFDETGTLTEIHGTAADITASYEAAQHLRESEALRNDTERFFGYGSWVWDLADPQNTYWSEGNIRLFGYQPHEVPGGRTTIEFFLRHVHPDDRERIIDTARQAVERHEDNLTQEYRAITRTGDVRYFLRRARLVYDEHGQPLRFMGQTADVTDERQLAEALRQSERLNRRLNELSPDFISLYDVKTSRNRYIGRHLREVLGYSEKEVGKHDGNLFFALEGEEDWALVRDFSAKIASLPDYDYLTYKVRMRAKDGRRVVIQSRSTVFRRGEEGQVAELMAVTQDVTEAETQAEALRQSEAFNRRLLELSPDVIGLYDLPTRRSRYVSDHTLPEWFGYTPEEVEALGGNLLGQFWTEADKAQFDAGFAQSLRTIAEGELISFLMNMRRKDGTLLVLFVRVSVIRCDDEGRPLELMSIYQNVTEREHLLDQLQRNEALLSQTEESLLFGSWEWDVPTGQITWSAGLWRIFGYDDREGSHPVTTDVLFGHLHPDDRAMIEAVNRKALAEPEPFGFEYRITDAHGQARVLAGRGVPLFDEQGRFTRLVGNTRDITAERQAAALARKQEYLLREAESLLKFGSWDWDVPTGEILWSEGMYAVFGYGPDNRPNPMTIGVLAGHLHPDDAGENTRVQDRIFNEKPPTFDGEFRILTMGGEERWLHQRGLTTFDETGQLVRMMGSTADVTPLKKFQAQLEQRIADLDRSNQDLEQFAYVASHDLQEPLRKITAFGGRLTARFATTLGPDGILFLDRMMDATARMKVLIDNLLSFSRVTRKADKYEPTDLNEVMNTVLGDLELKIQEKTALITVDTLPEVQAAPGQMQQLFQNLLTNALKFSQPDTPPIVSIRAEHVSTADKSQYHLELGKKYVRIIVQDNGIGFEPEYAGKIFVLFQRLHGRAEYEGTGIGLTICKKITENHQGQIFAESTPGKGARFTLLMPLAQV